MIAIPLTFLVILLILSGLFSSLETAYTSLSLGQIGNLAANKGKRGKLIKQLRERPEVLLTTLLIGNNLANLGASALTTAVIMKMVGDTYIAVATGLLTLIVLVFCEVTPKQIAMAANEKLCLSSARAVFALSLLFRPAVWLVSSVSRGITFLVVGRAEKEITLDSILHHVKAAEDEGVVESYEEEMVRNIFRINDTPVEALMTHRTELFTIAEDMPVSQALEAMLDSGHSRAPILRTGQEHVSGMVTLEDLIRAAKKSPETPVKKIGTQPYLVPGTMKAHDLFFRLKKEQRHMAIVLDEYGGLDGIVTREDIIEEIFGELYDESETEAAEPIKEESEGIWLIQGDADFYDVTDVLGLNLEHDSRTHTVAGYLMEQMEKIPAPGARINLPEGNYEILRTNDKRIAEVRFVPAPKEE